MKTHNLYPVQIYEFNFPGNVQHYCEVISADPTLTQRHDSGVSTTYFDAHKTGAYVQPVSKTASNNLKRIDRRSTGKTRAAKGIYSDKSWDRWLDNYYENLYNPKPERVFVDTPSTIKHLDYDTLFKDIVLYYKDNGYQHTMTYLKELYAKDKISMTHKAKITDELNGWEVMPKRLRKWAMKID